MHNIFHISLLEYDTTRKKRVDKRVTELKLEASNSKEYKVEAIWDSAVYTSESESGQLPGLYYLVAWKRYSKKENTWEQSSAVQHLKKLNNSFHKDHSEKPIATFPSINSAPPMARPIVRPNFTLKRKQGWPANGANKQARNWVFRCLWHLNNFLVKISVLANKQMKLAWVKSLLDFSPFQINDEALLPLSIASVFLLNSSY